MVTGNMTNLFKAETRIDIKFNHTLHFQKLMVKNSHTHTCEIGPKLRESKYWGGDANSEDWIKRESRYSSMLSKPVLLQSTHHSFLCSVVALLLEKGGARHRYINWSENGYHCKQDEHEPKICQMVFFHWRWGYLQCPELISS